MAKTDFKSVMVRNVEFKYPRLNATYSLQHLGEKVRGVRANSLRRFILNRMGNEQG